MEPNFRRCVSCRVVTHKNQLLRVVKEHSTGKLEVDRGMGRSAYLCWSVDCIHHAQKKKRLERALRSPISPDLYQVLEKKVRERLGVLNPR